MASKKYRPSRIVDLVKYTTELNELVLEIGSHTYTNRESKVHLDYGGYDEGDVPDRFNIVLHLNHHLEYVLFRSHITLK